MAAECRIPRSGVWYLRSKTDPRWDRNGQYSSLAGDPPLQSPAEAVAVRDILHHPRLSFRQSGQCIGMVERQHAAGCQQFRGRFDLLFHAP